MRRSKLAALLGAGAFALGANRALADTNLFVTQADFGGSQFAPGGSNPVIGQGVVVNPNPPPAGQITQTNWLGIGYYNSAVKGSAGGDVGPSDSYGNPITYPDTSLGGLNFTANGLGNYDNYNPASTTGKTPDAQLGTSYAGLTSPTGSLVINGYTGGYDTITTGEMITDYPNTATESNASAAFINALTTGTCLAYDITAPGGGTTASTTYYETTFETADNNGGFNGSGYMQCNVNDGLADKNTNEYGTGSGLTIGNDDPGSFAVVHGTGASSYYTVYLPYSFAANYASTLTYLQMAIELNSGGDQTGNVTIDNIRTVSPTWAASGSGLSWNTAGIVNYNESAPNGTPSNGVLTQSPNWVGGPGGYGVPNGSGVSATFGDLETGNASVGLDANQTVGFLNFNSLQYQYTLTPSSTGSSTAGTLVMDNTVNSAPAAINDMAGGTAATNYTEYVAAPVTLNSTTNVTVTRSTDILDITGNIGGVGGLSMQGAGTLQLYGTNTYSGGTSVGSGDLLVSSSGSLPANKAVSVTGGLLEIASTISGTGTLALNGVAISGGEIKIDPNATATSQSANPPVTAPTSDINITSLSITGSGTLDINNNHIIIDYTPGNDPIASIAALIKSGYANDAWNGPGIISTAAQSSKSYGIGYADAADSGNPAGLASGQIELMYTLLGDANLDGKVNGADFTLMAANFNDAVTAGWDKGDFNYDGAVNGTDFVLLANNFNQFASQSSVAADDLLALDSFAASNGISLTSVPEPTSLAILALGGIGLFSRRRKTRVAH